MRQTFGFVLAAVLIFAACSKTNTNSLRSVVGTWRYLGYDGGFAGQSYPAQHLESLELRRDMSYKREVNGSPTEAGTYSLTTTRIAPGTTDYPTIILGRQSAAMGYEILNDSLRMYDFAADGYEYWYMRSR